MDFGRKIGKFTKIIGKIHGSRKKKRCQSRITGKIKDSNSQFTKKIKLNSRITEKIRGGQFTVHEENKTQFTVHSKNKSPITVHGNTSLRPRPSRLVYWLNGRWFLQIQVVDRYSWNLYPLYPLFPCSDFVSQMWGWFGGGGGVMFFSHFMLFPTFLETKFGNVFFVFFLYAGNIEKCPITYSYWLNGRWLLQIVDIGNFIMRLEILKSASSLTG